MEFVIWAAFLVSRASKGHYSPLGTNSLKRYWASYLVFSFYLLCEPCEIYLLVFAKNEDNYYATLLLYEIRIMRQNKLYKTINLMIITAESPNKWQFLYSRRYTGYSFVFVFSGNSVTQGFGSLLIRRHINYFIQMKFLHIIY